MGIVVFLTGVQGLTRSVVPINAMITFLMRFGSRILLNSY